MGKVYNMWHLLWEEVKDYIVGPGYFCHEWIRYNKSEVLSQYMGICAIVPATREAAAGRSFEPRNWRSACTVLGSLPI